MFLFHGNLPFDGDVRLAEKVVQTEVPEQEYRLLKEAVIKRKLSIKEGLREAIRQWIETQIPIREDPLFKIEPVRTGVKTDSANLDKQLYKEP